MCQARLATRSPEAVRPADVRRISSGRPRMTVLGGVASPRVVVVTHASSRYSFGGGEIAAQRECDLLRECGMETLLIGAISRPKNQLAPAVEMINAHEAIFAVNEYDVVHEIWRDNQSVRDVLDLIHGFQPDVVHFHHC